MVAALIALADPNEKNAYVYTSPTFESKEQCVQFVQANIDNLGNNLMQELPNWIPQQYYCADTKMLENFFKTRKQDLGEYI